MLLTELAKEIHANAVAHGTRHDKISFHEVIALCHVDLSKALNEYRNGRPMIYAVDLEQNKILVDTNAFGGLEPKGTAAKLADCVMRMFDCCEYMGFDIGETVGRHRMLIGPCTIYELLCNCHYDLAKVHINEVLDLTQFMTCYLRISTWLGREGVELLDVMKLKHEYNKNRPYGPIEM